MQVSTKPFTKLFSSIITYSIWNENDKVRVVWITMLALSDANGFVCASVGGLAHAARVEKEDCEAALGYLCSPDDDSRSHEFEGRRIEYVEGGFAILNYRKYRELGRKLDRTEYLAAKKRESRERLSTSVNTRSTNVNKTSTLPSASASSSVLKKEGESEGKQRSRCTSEEAEEFCKSIGLPASDGAAMFLHWEEKGWGKIKDWKAVIRKWKAFGYLPSQKQGRNGPTVLPNYQEREGKSLLRQNLEQEMRVAAEKAKAEGKIR